MKSGKNTDSGDGLNFHGSVDKIRLKACINPIKTTANHVILRANDLPNAKVKKKPVPYHVRNGARLIFCPGNVKTKKYNIVYDYPKKKHYESFYYILHSDKNITAINRLRKI